MIRREIRVLLGTLGWPCGVLEVGSWAHHQELATVRIVEIRPGRLVRLPDADRGFLISGWIDADFRASLARHGLALSEETLVRRVGPDTWELEDRFSGDEFRLELSDAGIDLLRPANMEVARFTPPPEGDPGWRECLLEVGGAFLDTLAEFRPHVVGFRIEGGGLPRVRHLVAAVRRAGDSTVVLGGPTATSHPLEVLADTGADYVFAGEAEEPFAQFLRLARVPGGVDRLPEVPGLAYRYGGRAWHNSLPRDGYARSVLQADPQSCGTRLRCLRHYERPVAEAEVVSANRLAWELLAPLETPLDSLYFTGGRGCPGACTFCAKLHGQEVRVKSAEQLIEEIVSADRLVAEGRLRVTRWPLFAYVDDAESKPREVAWAAIYDEDFFLHRSRAMEFFQLWSASPLAERYRLSVQTNPCSLLAADGSPHAELFAWIDRLKPMIQLGGESFHPEVLARWRKRHTVDQLLRVMDALEATRQDYTVFQLLTDFQTTAEELIESLRLLVLHAVAHPRMRIASSPYTIPLYDSDTRPLLEYAGRLAGGRVAHFTDYERPQPGWMEPLVADLADLADGELQWALQPATRDAALGEAIRAVVRHLRQVAADDPRRRELLYQAERALK